MFFFELCHDALPTATMITHRPRAEWSRQHYASRHLPSWSFRPVAQALQVMNEVDSAERQLNPGQMVLCLSANQADDTSGRQAPWSLSPYRMVHSNKSLAARKTYFSGMDDSTDPNIVDRQ